jgi:hypothetical protein
VYLFKIDAENRVLAHAATRPLHAPKGEYVFADPEDLYGLASGWPASRLVEIWNRSYHKLGPQRFALTHDLNVVEIVRRLNTKPVIRIEAGAFVGYLENQQFRLGPTTEGIQPAVRKMIRLSSEDRLGGDIATREIA